MNPASLAFAIELHNWAFVIPPLFTVTAPEPTEKSSLEKDAIFIACSCVFTSNRHKSSDIVVSTLTTEKVSCA